jgi:SPP1 gp7 family putative phage head morphogenesis protein
MAELSVRDVKPEEAIKFFERKSELLRESFDWREVWQEEHARQFTVAKSAGRGVLEDIFSATQDAIQNGTTFAEFQKRLTPVLQAKGWWGGAQDIDPVTGEAVNVQLGSPRRLRIIYDTNVRMAFAAGRWERIDRTKALRPFLMYDAVNDARTRPQHRAWDNTVLPIDDPWWKTHYPPNGWNCRCSVVTLSQRQFDDMKGRGEIKTAAPGVKLVDYTNKRTGQTIKVPDGIDPGFGYNVGIAHLRELTPPPLPGAPDASRALDLFPASGRPDLPAPRVSPAPLMQPGLPAGDYVRAFLGELQSIERERSGDGSFQIGDGAVLKDAVGLPVTVSDRFLVRDDGSPKLDRSREQYARVLARTLLEPDEIWLSFEPAAKDVGGYQLRRRYVARWQLPERNAVTVIEESRDGWRGVTAFVNSGTDRYLDNQVRKGWLAYRRPGE